MSLLRAPCLLLPALLLGCPSQRARPEPAASAVVSVPVVSSTPPPIAPPAEEPGAGADDVPETARTPAGFAPEGWRLEAQVTGRLNGDGVEDLALHLIQKGAAKPNDPPLERMRMLVVALGQPNGGFKRVGLGDKILACTTCAGVYYMGNSPAADVTIDKGVLTVTQESGARDVSMSRWAFRFDPRASRMVLVAQTEAVRDRLEGTSQRTERVWAKGRVTVRKYTTAAPDAPDVLQSTATEAAPASTYLEDVDWGASSE